MIRVLDGRKRFPVRYRKDNKVGTLLREQAGQCLFEGGKAFDAFDLSPAGGAAALDSRRLGQGREVYALRQGLTADDLVTPVFHEENEDVVERFLSEHRAFKLDSLVELLPEKCHFFIKKGYFKTFPPADELDGFFAARLRKTS